MANEANIALTPTQERILGFIAMHSVNGGGACLSKQELAQNMGCCTKTVDRAIRKLKAEGYVEVLPIFGNNGGQEANRYRIARAVE